MVPFDLICRMGAQAPKIHARRSTRGVVLGRYLHTYISNYVGMGRLKTDHRLRSHIWPHLKNTRRWFLSSQHDRQQPPPAIVFPSKIATK